VRQIEVKGDAVKSYDEPSPSGVALSRQDDLSGLREKKSAFRASTLKGKVYRGPNPANLLTCPAGRTYD
jgi:hypothetical protein